MIEVHGLEKSFGETRAVRGVSFRAGRGEILGVLGPNGAGKTTCLRILCAYVEPDRGEVRVDGVDVTSHPLEARRRIGYLPENNPLYPEMRVAEYLYYRAGLKGGRGAMRDEEVRRTVKRCGLAGQERRLVGTLSKGFRQRVGIADALLNTPPVIVLDEPTVGLDPNQVVDVRELVSELREDHTVLLSSHVLSEIEQVCDRVVVFHEGRVVAEENMAALRGSGGSRLVVEARASDEQALRTLLSGIGRIVEATPLGDGWLRLVVESAGDARERLATAALGARVPLRQISPEGAPLERLFRRLTLGEDGA